MGYGERQETGGTIHVKIVLLYFDNIAIYSNPASQIHYSTQNSLNYTCILFTICTTFQLFWLLKIPQVILPSKLFSYGGDVPAVIFL